MLFSNGPVWRMQRKLAACPFSRTTLFQPERFNEFEVTFRQTIKKRIHALRLHLQESGQNSFRVRLEPEIKAVMLEMLVNNFFGAQISYDEIRNHFTPALERVIDHIVSDTVINQWGIPVTHMPSLTRRLSQIKADYTVFEELTDLAIAPRKEGRGLWQQFKSDAPDRALRSNIRVFLAGALEATTSFASWALSHLSRHPDIQQRVYQEVRNLDTYTPENLDQARLLNGVMEETLRLTPSLYFLPRKATADIWVETADKRKMFIPKGTHILLDIWHANRCEEYWGVDLTGYPASDFAPERWNVLGANGHVSKDFLHFGFGYGPRVCPGKFLGQLEVGLVVGAFVRVFKFDAVGTVADAKAGVSTKPIDGVLVDLQLRE